MFYTLIITSFQFIVWGLTKADKIRLAGGATSYSGRATLCPPGSGSALGGGARPRQER